MSTGKFQEEARLLKGKGEGVAGVPEALTNSDADVRARDIKLSSLQVDFDNESSKFATGDHTKDNAVSGIARGSVGFDVRNSVGYASHTGATLDTQHLEYSKYLVGCGLNMTTIAPSDEVTDDGKFVFKPAVSADCNTVSVELVDRKGDYAIGYKFAGAMSNLVIKADGAGKPITSTFDFKGKVSSLEKYENAGVVPEYTDDNRNVDAEKQLSTTFLSTVIRFTPLGKGGVEGTPVEFDVDTFNFDAGSTVVESTSQADPFGIKTNVITGREPMFTIDPDLKSLDDFDFWSTITTSVEQKIELVRSVGTVESFKLEIPRSQIMSPEINGKDGFVNNKLTCRALRPFGGDKEADYVITIGCKSYTA